MVVIIKGTDIHVLEKRVIDKAELILGKLPSNPDHDIDYYQVLKVRRGYTKHGHIIKSSTELNYILAMATASM